MTERVPYDAFCWRMPAPGLSGVGTGQHYRAKLERPSAFSFAGTLTMSCVISPWVDTCSFQNIGHSLSALDVVSVSALVTCVSRNDCGNNGKPRLVHCCGVSFSLLESELRQLSRCTCGQRARKYLNVIGNT